MFCTISNFYPSIDICKLKPQLNIHFQSDGFYKERLVNFIKTLMKDNLDNIFSEIVRFSKIIITTPMSKADTDRKFFFYENN